MACARAALRSRCNAPAPAPPDLLPLPYPYLEYSLTEVSLEGSSCSLSYGEPTATHAQTTHTQANLLENEVMVDPWSSMESSNSPLTESGPSASEECPTSTRPEADPDPPSLQNCAARNNNTEHSNSTRYLLLDEDFQPSPIPGLDACKIPKPHFLDHSPSPDEFDDRNDITNPNFLDEDDPPCLYRPDESSNEKGCIPKQKHTISAETQRLETTLLSPYRSHLQCGLQRSSHSSERDKRASQLYHGTWPGERDTWQGGQDTGSVKSFSSAGSANGQMHPHLRQPTQLGPKVECVYSLLTMLSMAPDSDADMSESLLEMSQSIESCLAMRQSGCIPLLVQLIHSKLSRNTRNRAAQALYNIVHTQPDDKAGRREARVLRLLTQVREYCFTLEDFVEMRKNATDSVKDESNKHPGQSVAALMKLSFDEEHRHVVCQLGGLQALALLVSLDQVAHGSHVEDNTCITMRKYAGMALTNLTFGDGNNKALLCSFRDFMMALVDQLQSPNDDMRQVTAAVLRNLSWRADSNSKAVLREVGAVVGLTSAAMTCNKESTLKSVLSALWNLTAHCSLNKVDLCLVDGALGFLVDMLSYNAPSKTLAIVENSGGILRNVSSHIAVREDYRLILRERNCLRVLLAHLKSPSLTVVSNSCGTLWNLSARCPVDQQYLWDHGAVAMLRSLIHSKHKMIAMGSSAALKNLLNSKPGKNHIISIDSTARNMNLPALPTLGARKQKALEHEIDQNLAETCDNIEPATSPTTNNRDEKNLFSATERHLAMNIDRHRMTSSSPLVSLSQSSLAHSAYISGYLSAGNTVLRNSHTVKSVTADKPKQVNRSESKDSIASSHSETDYDKINRVKVPVPTPRNRDIPRYEEGRVNAVKPLLKVTVQRSSVGNQTKHDSRPPVPPRRNMSDLTRSNYSESDFDGEPDLPTDFTQTYCEEKSKKVSISDDISKEEENKALKNEPGPQKSTDEIELDSIKNYAAEEDEQTTYGDYQETDLDQPTDFSLRYREHQSDNSSELSVPPHEPVHEDTIQHFCTEGTPYETPIVFSTATSMSDLRGAGLQKEQRETAHKEKTQGKDQTHSEIQNHSPVAIPNETLINVLHTPSKTKNHVQLMNGTSPNVNVPFDSKFSSGMISPEKPINYCDEGTPGCFSRVSSLSSLGESNEESTLAKKNAMATVNVPYEASQCDNPENSMKEREGMKAVTFAASPAPPTSDACSPLPPALPSSPPPPAYASSPPLPAYASSPPPAYASTPAGASVQETPLMFSRCSSLGSLSGCSAADRPLDDQGSIVSEKSRMTSGCISPSELPDSPGQSLPHSPRSRLHCVRRLTTSEKQTQNEHLQDFHEGVATFQVENTPLEFSTATSLSSLTIDDEPSHKMHLNERCMYEMSGQLGHPGQHRQSGQLGHRFQLVQPLSHELAAVTAVCGEDVLNSGLTRTNDHVDRISASTSGVKDSVPVSGTMKSATIGQSNTDQSATTGDSCITYFTEDTPAILSKAGSHGDLSLLSLETGDTSATREREASHKRDTRDTAETYEPDTSTDSCDLSDQGEDLLANCIQMGIKAINKGKPVQSPSAALQETTQQDSLSGWREGLHRSTQQTQPDFMLSQESPPPPLPPKPSHRAPPAPPRPATQDMRLASNNVKNFKKNKTNLVRNDSLSSLSIDSFGSTDRELFEQCVQSGMPKTKAKTTGKLKNDPKSHSAEHLLENNKRRQTVRSHKSLDRSDRRSSFKIDPEFESLVARGARAFLSTSKPSQPSSGGITRNAFTYHGDSNAHSLCHAAGPPSLPGRVSQREYRMTRSDSPSSLSGDSMGSTDLELFEQCVKMGMSKSKQKRRDSEEIRAKTVNRNFKMRSDEIQSLNQTVISKKDHISRSDRHSRPARGKSSDEIERVKNKLQKRCASEDLMTKATAGVYIQNADEVQRPRNNISERDEDLERLVYVGAKSFIKPGAQCHASLPYNDQLNNRGFTSQAKPTLYSEGPQSLPVGPPLLGDVEKLTRSNSLSSLSGDSLGSTDLELFEQCVIAGMNKSKQKSKCTEDIHTRTLNKNFKARAFNSQNSKRECDRPQPNNRSKDLDFEHLVSIGAKAFIRNDEQVSQASTSRINTEIIITHDNRSADDQNFYLGSKNVQASSVVAEQRLSIDNSALPAASDVKTPPGDRRDTLTSDNAHTTLAHATLKNGSEPIHQGISQLTTEECHIASLNNVTCDLKNSYDLRDSFFDKSNEYPAQDCSALEESTNSMNKTELDISNESYANMLTQSANSYDFSSNVLKDNIKIAKEELEGDLSIVSISQSVTRTDCSDQNVQYTLVDDSILQGSLNGGIFISEREKVSRKSLDTWNENTCSDDFSFPTISGSVPFITPFKSDINESSTAHLPDLLEESRSIDNVPLHLHLGHRHDKIISDKTPTNESKSNFSKVIKRESSTDLDIEFPALSFGLNSLKIEDESSTYTSLTTSIIIEKEAAQLAENLRIQALHAFASVPEQSSCLVSSAELELEAEGPPSHMGSLLSLTQDISGQWDDTDMLNKQPRKRPRKKSLPSTLVKRALGNYMNQGSTENLDSSPFSILENIKPPSEMDNIIDMESSMVSVSSIVSEVADARNQPVIFDFTQPVSDVSLLGARSTLPTNLHDVNPPSLFNELMMESTIELEQITAVDAFEDASNTLNLVNDIPSGSENCTPLQSDYSSMESTPKKSRNTNLLTPKERRRSAKERYMTYTIGDDPGELLQLELTDESFEMKSEGSSKTEEFVTARSEIVRKKLSPKQKRQEDRARYQTQTVYMPTLTASGEGELIDMPISDEIASNIISLGKKSMKQRRLENSDRYKTITLSDEATPSPVPSTESQFIYSADNVVNGEDHSLELVNLYESQSSADDVELNSAKMQTYTRSFRNYLPVIESPTAVDVCVAENLKNIEMSAAHGVHLADAYNLQPASGGDGTSLDFSHNYSEGEMEIEVIKAKPKIIKPKFCVERDESLDSNDSLENDSNSPKAVRGRKKATYISPYKRNVSNPKTSSLRPAASKSTAIVRPMSSRVITAAPKASKLIPPLSSKPTIPTKILNKPFPKQVKPRPTETMLQIKQQNSIPVSAVKPNPIVRQRTFTKEESTVLPKITMLTAVGKKSTVSSPKHNPNTSPSRLPQPNRPAATKPLLRKTLSNESPTLRLNSSHNNHSASNRSSLPGMKNSSSNQSLQSNDNGKTVTLNRNSIGSRTSSNYGASSTTIRLSGKEATSRISSLWKKVEQTKKKEQNKRDDRVWITNNEEQRTTVNGSGDTTASTSRNITTRLIRSSTFEGQPKADRCLEAAPKQKSSIAIKVSQIPNLRHNARSPRSTEAGPASPGFLRKATTTKIFTQKNRNSNQELIT